MAVSPPLGSIGGLCVFGGGEGWGLWVGMGERKATFMELTMTKLHKAHP